MRFRACIIITLILSFLSISPAWAQQSVVSSADLRAAMADKAKADEASRELVVSVLRDSRIKQLAADLSLDRVRAERAVATLGDKDLEAAASSARLIERDLAGEASTVTISLTTLLLIIIIILLVAN
jgi:hypothetical protein